MAEVLDISDFKKSTADAGSMKEHVAIRKARKRQNTRSPSDATPPHAVRLEGGLSLTGVRF